MKISKLILLPFAGPFVVLIMGRALWYVAGAEWSSPGDAAGISACIGVFGGIYIGGFLAESNVDVGHFTVGKGKADDQ